MPVNNEHRNEIVEESAEEMQDQTTNETRSRFTTSEKVDTRKEINYLRRFHVYE